MELCLQLHHREFGSFYLNCEKLLNSNNNTEIAFFQLWLKTPIWSRFTGRFEAIPSVWGHWGDLGGQQGDELSFSSCSFIFKKGGVWISWDHLEWNEHLEVHSVHMHNKTRNWVTSMLKSSGKEWVVAGPLITWRRFPVNQKAVQFVLPVFIDFWHAEESLRCQVWILEMIKYWGSCDLAL